MATLITPSGTLKVVQPKNGSTVFTAAEIHDLIEGYLECVYLSDGRLMWINEDGKRQGLAPNMVATFVALNRLQRGDVIVGNAVITTRSEAGEEEL